MTRVGDPPGETGAMGTNQRSRDRRCPERRSPTSVARSRTGTLPPSALADNYTWWPWYGVVDGEIWLATAGARRRRSSISNGTSGQHHHRGRHDLRQFFAESLFEGASPRSTMTDSVFAVGVSCLGALRTAPTPGSQTVGGQDDEQRRVAGIVRRCGPGITTTGTARVPVAGSPAPIPRP